MQGWWAGGSRGHLYAGPFGCLPLGIPQSDGGGTAIQGREPRGAPGQAEEGLRPSSGGLLAGGSGQEALCWEHLQSVSLGWGGGAVLGLSFLLPGTFSMQILSEWEVETSGSPDGRKLPQIIVGLAARPGPARQSSRPPSAGLLPLRHRKGMFLSCHRGSLCSFVMSHIHCVLCSSLELNGKEPVEGIYIFTISPN